MSVRQSLADLFENLMPYRDLVRKKQIEQELLHQAEAEAEAAQKRISELSSLRHQTKDPYRRLDLADGKLKDSVDDEAKDGISK